MVSVQQFFFGRFQAAPGVERIVDLELPLDVLDVVGIAQAVAGGDGFEAGGEGVVFKPAGVRGIDDLG